MLIHPRDTALDMTECEGWLNDGHDFGQLVVNGVTGEPPHVIPTAAPENRRFRPALLS